MTGIVILIVMIILLWLIVQGVILVLLWGQQQRSQARADLLARLAGVSSVDEPPVTEPKIQPSRLSATKPESTSPQPFSHTSTDNSEPERPEPVSELAFPPPIRQPVVPPAREPIPRREEITHQSLRTELPASTGSDITGVATALDHQFATADRERSGDGLPAGSVLPDFELPSIDGESFGRSKLTGARAMMLFLAVDSPGSAAVMESIRSPQVRKRTLPDLVLVINGGVETSSLRRWLGKLPKRVTVLIQEDTELATVLRVSGTPSAYLLDDQNRTRGPLRTGARAILEALGVSTSQMTGSARRSTSVTPHAQITQRAYSGLPVGSPAPEIELTLSGGGVWERSAGRSALLIFWDSDCQPCQSMRAELVGQSASWSGFDTVLIARGSSAGTADASEFDGRLPVAVQRGFDVSRRFHLLESPAAVAIGPDGAILRPPAVGASGVLALAAELHQRSRRGANHAEDGSVS